MGNPVRGFEPPLQFVDPQTGVLTRRADAFLRDLFGYVGAGVGTIPPSSLGGGTDPNKFLNETGVFTTVVQGGGTQNVVIQNEELIEETSFVGFPVQGSPGTAGTTGGTGPAGPAIFLLGEGQDGDPGPPGVRGADGTTGPAGADGNAGSPGVQGQIGAAIFLAAEPGLDGDPGPPGSVGPTGATGGAGSPGAQGPVGAAIFLAAEDGLDGDPGPPGARGADGAAGSAGSPGAQGPLGAAIFLVGEDGPPGEWTTGPPGAVGPQGSTGAQGPTDLVFTATSADTSIASITDVSIVSQNVTSVVAGDKILVDCWFTVLNNSTATRVCVFTLDFDGLFDNEFSTGALATSSTLMHPFHIQAACDIRASNLVYAVIQVDGQLAAGVASGGDTTMGASSLYGMGWGTSTSDATGTTTVTLVARSASATATQTLRLHSFTIRKVH